jgi:PAS domain S-box-containing protein
MEQKKQAELESEGILRHLPCAVITVDKKWTVVSVNPAAEALTGRTSDKWAGQSPSEILKLLDRNNKDIQIPTARVLQQQRQPITYWGVLLSTANGSLVPVDITFSPVASYRAAPSGYVIVFTNASERVRKDEESLNRHKMEAISTISGSISHDFSNSLSVISGHASSIIENLIPKTRAHEEALRILDAAKRAGTIAKRLMGIARIGTMRTDMTVETVALGTIVKEAVRIVEDTTGAQKISFKIRNADAMPYIMADDRQMLDCLLNLLLNSVEAMPDGGTIAIDTTESTLRKTNYVVLRIRDTGTGMSKDVLARAVEPFFSTKPVGTGAGLGLTVVETSLKRWGGFLKIRSRPEQGTSIRLFLRKARSQPRESAREERSGRETILIIDDKKGLLTDSADALRLAGYNVHTALGGDEGLALYKKHADEIDLSIIDFVMPNTYGKKVLEEILAADPTALIIMMSGFSRDYLRTLLERGAWGFIQKPFTNEHLLATVRRLLDQEIASKMDTVSP